MVPETDEEEFRRQYENYSIPQKRSIVSSLLEDQPDLEQTKLNQHKKADKKVEINIDACVSY